MSDFFSYYAQLPLLEWFGVLAALLYVIFAACQNILCWPAALVSTILYTYIFYDVYLWMDSLLQVYYIIMALYGWYCWTKVDINKPTIISTWPWKKHLNINMVLIVISFGLGYLMANYTPTDFPYLDSFTTVFAVFTTYLVTQKVLENWLYWIVIDAASIFIYFEKSLEPTAYLFILYVGLACFGYLRWLANYKAQQSNDGLAKLTLNEEL